MAREYMISDERKAELDAMADAPPMSANAKLIERLNALVDCGCLEDGAAISESADTIARLEEENGSYRAALKSIVGMDSHIDATVSGGRKVVHGPIAAVAARALATGDAG